VSEEEVSSMRAILSSYMPQINGNLLETTTCMYTMTDDEHFFIDNHPDQKHVLLVSPCSGHGFKFCSVIGEIVSDLIISETTHFDISLFRSRKRKM
jgi:glycine/D-amino acid oxidase-like deaminating enzyme